MIDRDAFRALCSGIHAFQAELQSADMKTSLVINLDPIDFSRVVRDLDPMFGAERQSDGSLKVMDAVIRARRLKD